MIGGKRRTYKTGDLEETIQIRTIYSRYQELSFSMAANVIRNNSREIMKETSTWHISHYKHTRHDNN